MAKRTETARVTDGKNTIGAYHHQRKRAFYPAKRIGHRFGQRVFFGKRNQMNDDFGVAVGLENRSLGSPVCREFPCVDQIAVVGNRDDAFVRLHHDRLRVEQRGISSSRVARMSDRQRSAHLRENVR